MIRMSGQYYEPKEFIDAILRIFEDPMAIERDQVYAIDCLTEWIGELDSEKIKHWLLYCEGYTDRPAAKLVQHWIYVIANFCNSESPEFMRNATESIIQIIQHDPSFISLSMPIALDFEGSNAQKIELVWKNELRKSENKRRQLLQNALEFFRERDASKHIADEIANQLNSNQVFIDLLTSVNE